MKDPANLRGTGPWMIKEYREGVSFTLQKNPDYWGYDELFPDHKFQLPYADEFKKVFIDDMSLRLAALRTGKLDVLDNLHMGDRGISWEDKESLDKSTPDLKYVAFEMTGCGLVFRYDKKPFFPDIRVRQAMQMAINREEINRTWGGSISKSLPPMGNKLCFDCVPGSYTPFDQLSKSVQETYTYNPQKAKQLLAEAGYPNGFKTSVVYPSHQDTDLLEIAKGYLAAIGVDMEIKLLEGASFNNTVNAGNFEMYNECGYGIAGPDLLAWYGHWGTNEGTTMKPYNEGKIDYPHFNKLLTEANAADDEAGHLRKVKEAADYMTSQHWMIPLGMAADYRAWWPSLKGYRGELRLGMDWGKGQLFARVWVDQELKKSMGF